MKRLIVGIAFLLTLTGITPGQAPAREFVVTLKSQSIDRVNRKYGTTTVKEIRGNRVYLLREASAGSITLANLASDSSVESVEANSDFRLGDDTETVYLLDTGDQVILNGNEVPRAYAEQTALSIIEGDKVRSISTGAGTRVAFVDTGVDFFHPAIRPWLDPGVDLIDGISASEGEAPDSALPSAVGHGTLVAGVIHLVAPDAVLVPIKAFDPYGKTTLFRIVESVYQAIDLEVDVLNMSFSTAEDSPALRKAINAAKASGITVVSSMGNEGVDVGSVFPASYTNVFGVGASDFQDQLAVFSNYGRSVSIVAPGAYVVSTSPGGKYAAAWGTSFSAPLVSGAAALMASLRPHGNSEAPLILNTADPIGDSNGQSNQAGKGRLNVRKALERVKNGK